MSPSNPLSEKETLVTRFQMQITVKSKVNRANIFCRKKIKVEGSVIFQNIFSWMTDFRDVVSVLSPARITKASRIFVGVDIVVSPQH